MSISSDLKSLRVLHTGWAVHAIKDAMPVMEALGYRQAGDVTHDISRDVDIAIMNSDDGHCVELVAPMSERSPVSNFLKKNGPGPYHCCYTVDDLEKTRAALKQIGFAEITRPAEAPALGGEIVVFLWSKQIGMIELSTNSKDSADR